MPHVVQVLSAHPCRVTALTLPWSSGVVTLLGGECIWVQYPLLQSFGGSAVGTEGGGHGGEVQWVGGITI